MPSDRKRGLGRGFDSLIPTAVAEPEFDVTAKPAGGGAKVSADMVRLVPAESISPNPHQPRTMFDPDQMQSLADSIREHGILQPLVATEQDDGKYELIAGERRLRAAKLAGLREVPVIVRSFNEQQKLELALIENLQRQDLNPIETAAAYRKLVDQFNLSPEKIGKRIGKDRSTITNTMRLLQLPLEAKRAVAAGKIMEGHARVILTVMDPQKQLMLLDMIIKNKWNTRQAEEFARGFREPDGTKEKALKRIEQTNELTQSLGRHLGTKVKLQNTANGGKLIIEYYSEEELQRIYETIKRATA